MRKQFTFYRSFFDSLSLITDRTERTNTLEAICLYALDGVEPDMESLGEAGRIAFVLIRPVLDTAAKRAVSGQKGGSAPKHSESKPKAKAKQSQREGEKEKEIEIENENEIENEIEIETENEQDSALHPPVPLTGDLPPEGGGARRRKKGPPSLEEVRAYCQKRGTGVDPDQWYDYYAANGWRVGKNPMKDWKAAVRNWERTEFRSRSAPGGPGPAQPLTPERERAQQRALEENQAELKALLARCERLDRTASGGNRPAGLSRNL